MLHFVFLLLGSQMLTEPNDSSFTVYNSTELHFRNPAYASFNVLIIDPHVLYIGVDNIIKIEAQGYDLNKVEATVSQGRIIKSGENFYVSVLSVSEDVKIHFYINKNGTEQTVKDVSFKSRSIPELNAVRSVQCSYNLSIAEVRKISVHQLLQLPDDVEILNFNLVAFPEDGSMIVTLNHGDEFSKASKLQIAMLKAGTTINIDMILLRANNSIVTTKMPSLSYLIVD